MRVMLASHAGTPGWPNEDFAAAAPGVAVLLDGATQVPRDADSGCVHGVAWYARSLGTALLAEILARPGALLANALAAAIAQVRARHADSCDLSNPRTPSATVTALRRGGDGIEYLALSDSTVAADLADSREPLVITDERRAGPYRVAAASPEAAGNSLTGIFPLAGLQGVALLSDGAARLADRYGLISWPEVVALLRESGPAELIRRVRAAEASDADCSRWPRRKPSDDATAIYWHLGPEIPGGSGAGRSLTR
jgi:Protein phosphatase 2C